MADKIVPKIDVKSPCHRLVFPSRSWRWRQRDLDAKRIQNFQSLSDFAGILALFKLDDEPYSGSGGQSKILLRNSQILASLADQGANFARTCISSMPSKLPVR